MNDGWVKVDIPAAAVEAASWRVIAGAARGNPGEALDAGAGTCVVVVEADLTLPNARALGRLEMQVPVEPGRVTRAVIPLPEPMVRSYLSGAGSRHETQRTGHRGAIEEQLTGGMLMARRHHAPRLARVALLVVVVLALLLALLLTSGMVLV